MKPAALALFAAFSLSGCKTLEFLDGGGSKIVRIETEPPGAVVRVEKYGECTSPCTIGLDVSRKIDVSKDGYDSQSFYVNPNSGKVHVILELAAASTGVDSGALPDLPGE